MRFRNFKNTLEEQKAANIIATIDQGEKWIFEGADGSPDFGGFIDKLFYCNGSTYGTFCSCIYNGNLRLQIGFNPDMPAELSEELLSLIIKARNHLNTFTSVWYPPDNTTLDKFLFASLPWEAHGHKTHELTFFRAEANEQKILPSDVRIIPFAEEHLEAVCKMLDKALSHTFDEPNASVFFSNKEQHLQDWKEKAKNGDCCVILKDEELAGAYILKDSEIDFIAISVAKQGKGLGALLLHHAINHILATKKDNPFLYCVDRNPRALRFYLREGMKITGYSGYAFFHALPPK